MASPYFVHDWVTNIFLWCHLKHRQRKKQTNDAGLCHVLFKWQLIKKFCRIVWHHHPWEIIYPSALQHFCSVEYRKAVRYEGLHYPLTSMSPHPPTVTHTHTHTTAGAAEVKVVTERKKDRNKKERKRERRQQTGYSATIHVLVLNSCLILQSVTFLRLVTLRHWYFKLRKQKFVSCAIFCLLRCI